MRSAHAIEQTLLEVLDMEATRLLDKLKSGQALEPSDRVQLTYYLRSATDAAKAEIERINKLRPESLNDELLARLMDQEGVSDGKPAAKRRRSS